ncbi:bone marrow proteoglycan-like [Dromiciops gliroides]|uniref:bone marrow proteoglycan-like n=1 Tax=Dromiciops gliroides TaxID=33562 RepID=UPI001CC81022|nr:bone marrow proteoglycan-like [Dromiciops gliroides]
MKLPLILSLLLLGTVSSLHLKNEALELEASEGEKALAQEVETPEEEDNLTTGDEEEDDEGTEVEVAEDDNLCPKEEDVVHMLGSPGCKTCRFLIVRKPRTFRRAQKICRRCYRGNLVSIHSSHTNSRIQCSVRGINQGQIWIGGRIKGRHRKRFWWVDGSSWTFSYWAAGQPARGGGCCVALCTRGGHWRRAPCRRRLPFACSY